MKNFLTSACIAAILSLQGCYTPLIEGAQEGYDGARRDSLQAKAQSGDPEGEFELGNTFCCQGAGPLHDVSIYDNVKATRWYCNAARQGYLPAQMRLARLYSGHPIRGLHIALRISDLMGTDDTNISVALMWATLAAKSGEKDAIDLRDDINDQATIRQRERANAFQKEWQTSPCLWNEVIPAAAKKAEK